MKKFLSSEWIEEAHVVNPTKAPLVHVLLRFFFGTHAICRTCFNAPDATSNVVYRARRTGTAQSLFVLTSLLTLAITSVLDAIPRIDAAARKNVLLVRNISSFANVNVECIINKSLCAACLKIFRGLGVRRRRARAGFLIPFVLRFKLLSCANQRRIEGRGGGVCNIGYKNRFISHMYIDT